METEKNRNKNQWENQITLKTKKQNKEEVRGCLL